MKIFFALFFAVFTVAAQPPEVPHKMQFAGMTLTIRDDARREIQKDVNALTQSPKHHNIKVERAKTYFPIIEKVFAEENLPDDFKYLVLQESALIADAVSVSNAVGFWQFKDFTALEMGLRVDRLARLSYGPVRLGDLAPGRYRPLTPREEAALYKAVRMTPEGE